MTNTHPDDLADIVLERDILRRLWWHPEGPCRAPLKDEQEHAEILTSLLEGLLPSLEGRRLFGLRSPVVSSAPPDYIAGNSLTGRTVKTVSVCQSGSVQDLQSRLRCHRTSSSARTCPSSCPTACRSDIVSKCVQAAERASHHLVHMDR